MTDPAFLSGVEWRAEDGKPDDGGLPHVTHSGVLKLGELELNCYRLSNGQAIIDSESMEKFLEWMGLRE